MKKQKWHSKFLIGIFLAVVMLIVVFNPHASLSKEEETEWGYGGAANPTQWSELSPEFVSCELGRDQSPINLSQIEEGEVADAKIEFNYRQTSATVVDNGHTIQVNYEPGNTISINGEVYELLQFHFHTPSEHQIENESLPMELHLVHQNEAGELAVVGVLMDVGAKNSLIADIWEAIPQGGKKAKGNGITVDAANLLPENKTFVSYQGSLTTPPCSEQVSWNLMLEPIKLSSSQIETFESIYSYNARPVQPLNGRLIEINRN